MKYLRIFARIFEALTKNNIQMNKIINNPAFAPLGTSTYESPSITVVDALAEGVLCSSMKDNTFEPWEEDDDLWS